MWGALAGALFGAVAAWLFALDLHRRQSASAAEVQRQQAVTAREIQDQQSAAARSLQGEREAADAKRQGDLAVAHVIDLVSKFSADVQRRAYARPRRRQVAADTDRWNEVRIAIRAARMAVSKHDDEPLTATSRLLHGMHLRFDVSQRGDEEDHGLIRARAEALEKVALHLLQWRREPKTGNDTASDIRGLGWLNGHELVDDYSM